MGEQAETMGIPSAANSMTRAWLVTVETGYPVAWLCSQGMRAVTAAPRSSERGRSVNARVLIA